MAITTDTGAKKISGSDNWREIFDDHNDTVDAYDKNITDLHNDIGIVVNGNKTAFPTGAAIGGFVILKNSTISDGNGGTLDDGLYTAAKAIPYDSAIDNTYLTPVSGGGLNALNSKIDDGIEYASVAVNATKTFSNCKAGTMIYGRNSSNSTGFIRIVTDANGSMGIIADPQGLPFTVSNSVVSVKNTGSSVLSVAVMRY